MRRFQPPPAPKLKIKIGSPEHVRLLLGAAIKRVGGFTQSAHAAGVTENSVRTWWKNGSLNSVNVVHALRFADAAKEPIDHFLVDWR